MRTLMVLAVLTLCWAAEAAVFQYHSQFTFTHRDKERTARVLLWLPPEAERINGVLVAGMTSAEGDLVRDPILRAGCAEAGVAIVYFSGGLRRSTLNQQLAAFAEQSGYSELPNAGLFFFGHSAGGGPALGRGVAYGSQTLGVIQFRGGMPAPDSGLLPGTPSLALMAEFDEYWGTMRRADGYESWQRALNDFFIPYRVASEEHLGAFMVEPGSGHFAWTEANGRFLADWITTVTALRVPADWDGTAPLAATPLSAASGWLTNADLDQEPVIASYADYPGDKSRTSWHPTEALARASLAYHEGLNDVADQFLKWNEPVWVDAGVRHFFTGPQWTGAGASIQPRVQFAQRVPGRHNNQGPEWLNAGEAVGNNGRAITVRPISGPAVATSDTTFRLALDNVFPGWGSAKIVFIAEAAGGDGFRATSQIGMMQRGFKGLQRGAQQTIDWAPLPAEVTVGSAPIPLTATSSAELPVYWYVAHGPAAVVDGQLVISDVPHRANLPIEITLVAYQPGSALEPQVRASPKVSQTITLVDRASP